MSQDNPKNQQDKKDTPFWYFAIGAMMNPISIQNRGIVPISSVPGELLDFKLHFFGTLGLAQAVPSQGDSFHGVLHLVHPNIMVELDKVEIEYVRTNATARLYNGTLVHDVTVYTKPDSFHRGKDAPPAERYLQIMSMGAEHYGVKPEHVQYLRNHKCQPRPQPHEFRSFVTNHDDVPLDYMTMKDHVVMYNGQQEETDDVCGVRFTVNGKVVELKCQPHDKDWTDFSGMIDKYGQHLELFISKILYDPKYGMPKTLSEFTREHCAAAEDHVVRFADSRGILHKWHVIGRFQQEYAD